VEGTHSCGKRLVHHDERCALTVQNSLRGAGYTETTIDQHEIGPAAGGPRRQWVTRPIRGSWRHLRVRRSVPREMRVSLPSFSARTISAFLRRRSIQARSDSTETMREMPWATAYSAAARTKLDHRTGTIQQGAVAGNLGFRHFGLQAQSNRCAPLQTA
jgi:hypothetical protein